MCMQCPNCGGIWPGTGQCPYCDSWLPGETYKENSLPLPDPGTIPMGRFKGILGYFELRKAVLLVRSVGYETTIPYDKLVAVYYRECTRYHSGELAVRWMGNQYLPFPLKALDITSVGFTEKQEEAYYELYCFLNSVAQRNQIKTLSFEDRQAQLDYAGTPYCPQCLSTQFSTLGGGFYTSYECPYCRYIWRGKR